VRSAKLLRTTVAATPVLRRIQGGGRSARGAAASSSLSPSGLSLPPALWETRRLFDVELDSPPLEGGGEGATLLGVIGGVGWSGLPKLARFWGILGEVFGCGYSGLRRSYIGDRVGPAPTCAESSTPNPNSLETYGSLPHSRPEKRIPFFISPAESIPAP